MALGTPPTGRPRWRAGPGWAWLAFPLLVVVVVAVLTALDINGSSVGVLSPSPASDPSLLAGTPRVVRGDEAAISTPITVGNVRRGMPVQPWVGLTPTFLPATALGAPAAHWSEVFKPQDWAYSVLDVQRAFTLHWWAQAGIGVLGLFALLAVLIGRGWVAGGLAVVGTFTPYVAWWSLAPGLPLGYGAGAGALGVLALRARSPVSAVVYGLGAGYLAVAAFVLLYPPWLISVAWVVVAIVVGAALDARVSWHRPLLVAAAALLVVLPSLYAWYQQSAPAIAAQAGTYYPGNRISSAGGAVISWLFSANANPWVAAAPAFSLRGTALDAVGESVSSNQSELSSVWLPLPVVGLVVVAVLVLLRRQVRRRAAPGLATASHDLGPDDAVVRTPVPCPLFWTTVATCAATLLLLAWALLPLPAWLGRYTLLDRVPGVRTSLALGLGVMVLLAIGLQVVGRARKSALWVVTVVLVAGATIWLGTWAGSSLNWDAGGAPPPWQLAVVSGYFAVGFVLLLWHRLAPYAVAMLVLGAIASWALVNPWYVGLGPLTRDPVVQVMTSLSEGGPPQRVTVYGGGRLPWLVQASGAETLSGVTYYPDAAVWASLAPDQQLLWNNYSKYVWEPDPALDDHALIEPRVGTLRTLLIDPCARSTLALHIDWALSYRQLSGYPCLVPYDVIDEGQGRPVYLYRVFDPTRVTRGAGTARSPAPASS
jgi:hypothetical protein